MGCLVIVFWFLMAMFGTYTLFATLLNLGPVWGVILTVFTGILSYVLMDN